MESPQNYTYFYDTIACKLSPTYNNVYTIEGDKVAYFKENKLIISHIIDENEYYKEIERNWSRTAVP